ncbi:hypothetical protein FSP39_023755 [Pinctada imbricata]|uniref:Death domain-containing protein n=1 Tax=Pinctada imbricata TaxID=66713 RepID=A0AA88Y3Y1_PINIB|nr:hypothetical protein FSP39_023755 [Pinctada imbricata]
MEMIVHVVTTDRSWSTFVTAKKSSMKLKIFLCAEKSLEKIIETVDAHARSCTGQLKIKKITTRGHVVMTNLKCENLQQTHNIKWSSSPYLPNKEYLVNSRVNHGLICSGMLPSHYNRFVDGAGIGKIGKAKREKFFKSYKKFLQDECKESMSTAILEEVASYEDEKLGEVDIMTDARHGWRKNAKDSTIVALGDKTHKVISCQHITKSDDRVTQRHEKIGTKKIYEDLQSNDVSVGVHVHDRNLSINKFIRDETDATNQNDTWHCIKSLKVRLQKAASGPAYLEGKTWSFQLSDKVEPIATHIHWSIRNCNGDITTLRSSIDNIVEHYKDNHSSCHSTSRCKEPKYEISRTVITDPKAEKLLKDILRNSTIFKYPGDYILAKDTFYVESFNNVVNVYQDKRISFSDSQYNARSNLSVCHWNENVDRSFTESEKKPAMDQAMRDILKKHIADEAGVEVYRNYTLLSIQLAANECCSTAMPFVLLSDTFDLITLEECEEVFNLVEENLSVWKSETFYDAGKNYLLRMCNDLLRRLSKSQNTVFCGRIQLFLSRLFPLSEKSALNLMGQFNLDNITTFSSKSEEFKFKAQEIHMKDDVMEVEEGEMEDFSSSSTPIDYNLYRRFWTLQDYFRKPTQCYDKVPFKAFAQNADAVLSAFASSKLDDLKTSRKKLAMPRTTDSSTFFAKYLTSEKLLDLQLNDSNFRRYVLVQFLILFQYLNAQVKFKNAAQALTEENAQWIKVTQDKVYQLIRETPPNGDQFAKTVEHILTREEYWNKWKNEGCSSFERSPATDQTKPKTKAKRKWVGDDLQAHGRKTIKMGSAELTRLWNLAPNNMDACKSDKRIFLPTLEDHFADAMEQADPDAHIEHEYKLVHNQIFQWKSLRLLARRSPHFFNQTTTPAMPLPQYLDLMLQKIAKEIPQTVNNEEMRTDVGEEETIKEGHDEEDLKQGEEQDVAGDEEAADDPLTKEQLQLMSEKLGEDWKRLAIELNFPEDDLAYFETENELDSQRAFKMLTIWQEKEEDRATCGSLKIALKEVGLPEVIEAVFGE